MFRGLKKVLLIFTCVICIAVTSVYADNTMPTPTLTNINTQLTSFLNSNTKTYSLTKNQATNNDIQIVINGTTYYTTPIDASEKASLELLSKYAYSCLKETTSENAVYSYTNEKGITTYYGYDTALFANSIYNTTTGTSSNYDFIFKYLNSYNGLDNVYYSINILSAYISSHTQLTFENANRETDSTISVNLPNKTVILKYVYTAPSGYTETSNRIDNPKSKEINNYVFQNISSTESGGAVANTLKNQILINSDFIKNVTTQGFGGAIYNKSNLTANGVFINNSSTSTNATGGAIYNTNELTANSDFVKNFASGETAFGGAIANIGTSTYANIIDLKGSFAGNYAQANNGDAFGGAVYNFSDSLKAITNINNIDAPFISNYAYSQKNNAYGGAIYNGGLFSNIDNIVGDFISNKTNATQLSSGGAIYNEVTIKSIIGDFVSNTATSSTNTAIGGALYNSGNINSLYGTFLANRTNGTSAQGGAVANEGVLNIEKADFISNTAVSKEKNASGGAIYNNSILKIKDKIIFSGNNTSSQSGNSLGGAIYNIGTIEGTLAGEFNGNYAQSNTGSSYGGSIYNFGYIEAITSNFTQSNTSGESAYGGAIYNQTEIMTITSNFNQNNATSNTLTQGGAIFNKGSIFSLISTFDSNVATSTKLAQGGAIYNIGDIFSFNADGKYTDFKNNYATGSNTAEAGAIYNAGSIFDINKVNFTENYVNANTNAKAGAILNSGYITELKENSFVKNYAYSSNGRASGGAIYNTGTINEVQTEFKNNYANGNTSAAGALYNDGFIMGITSLFEGNYAYSSNGNAYGGAIYHSGAMTSGILNSTFTDNYTYSRGGNAYGGAIYAITDLTIRADNGQTLFKGNYVQNGYNKTFEAVYVGDTSATLTLNATNRGQVIFDDSINGTLGYKISVTGDADSSVVFNNKVFNAVITLNNTLLQFNETTFAKTNTLLITKSGFINLLDNTTRNYSISNLTSSANASYSIDIDPSRGTADTITIENNASGTVTIDNLNYLSQITETKIIPVLITDSNNIELVLKDSVEDLSRNISNTVFNTDLFKQSSGASVVDKHSIKVLIESELDGLKLLNEKETNPSEIREFVFNKNSDNTYKVLTSVTNLGVTTLGELDIVGSVLYNTRSFLDFSKADGFNLQNKTTLLVSDTTLSNANTLLTIDNQEAVANFENAELSENKIAINNISGTVNFNNSIVEPDVIEDNNKVINKWIFNTKNSEIKTTIENSGTLNTQEQNSLYRINNTGTISTSGKTEFNGVVTNDGTIELKNTVIFSEKLTNNLNGTVNTSNSSTSEGIYFGEIQNNGTINLNASNNNFNNTVINDKDIIVNGNTTATATIDGNGTTTVNKNLILSNYSKFTEQQILHVEENGAVVLNGGELFINTTSSSSVYINNDVINGKIRGNSGTIQINSSEMFDRQFDLTKHSNINVSLTETLINLSDGEYKDIYLGNLSSSRDSSFKIDINLATNECDTITVHSNSNAVINITELSGLSKELLPVNDYLVFQILNSGTNAELYLDEGEEGIVQQYSSSKDLSEFYNGTTNTYEVTSEDFIGTMGISLDETKTAVLVGNLTKHDMLNYINTQNNIKRVFKVTSKPFIASKSASVTGSGQIEVSGETSDSNSHIIDFDKTYSGFEINKDCGITIKNVTIQNGKAAQDIGAGAALKIQNSNSNIVVNNVIFKTNNSFLTGGAIYIEGVLTDLINSSFYGNYVYNDSATQAIHGGAIFSTRDLTIRANNGMSEFKDNYIQNADGDKIYEAIYMSSPKSTLSLEAVNDGVISISDSINGDDYYISINGDSTGNIILKNHVKNASVEAKNVTLTLSTNTFKNTNSILNVTSGYISTRDNEYDDYSIDYLNSSQDAQYLIDFDLYLDDNNNLQYASDRILVSNSSSSGVIYLSDENFAQLGLDDKTSELSQYLFKNKDTYFVIKILDTPSNSSITIDLDEHVHKYDLALYNYNVKSSDFIGEIGIRRYGNDSIELGVITNNDTLIATNEFESLEKTRTFTLEEAYLLTYPSLGKTGAGKFELFSDKNTINFNNRNGFILDSEGKTELIINNTVLANADCAIKLTTSNPDSTVTLNNVVLSENNIALESYGKVYFNSTQVGEAGASLPNLIYNSGTLFLNGTNIIASDIRGKGSIQIQSGDTDLSKSFIYDNTVYLNNSELIIGGGTFEHADLYINAGSISFGDDTYTDYYFNKLTINSDFNVELDVDAVDTTSDRFYVGEGSTGVITIESFKNFEISDFEDDTVVKILFKENGNDNIKLALSEDLQDKPIDSFTLDSYLKDGHYIANDTDKICKIILRLNDTADSLVIKAEKNGSVLSIFNQHKYSERIFNIVSEVYVEEYNLGSTASGKMVVNGNNNILDFGKHSGFELTNSNTTLELNNVHISNAVSENNGSVINATAYTGNQINIVDSSFENNTSSGLGGAIYTSSALSIKADTNDVIFNNNLANGELNDIYIDNSKNTNVSVSFVAKEGCRIELTGGIDFNKTGLTVNINDKDSSGSVAFVGNLGTSADKLINTLNLNGGTLSLMDNIIGEIYVKTLNINENTAFAIDIDVLNTTSDKFVIPDKSNLPNAKLMLDIENMNMLSFFTEPEQSAAIKLINTDQQTTRYFGFNGTNNDVYKYSFNDVDYYFILADEGYLVISRDVPDYFMHPLVTAIRNPNENTYTMYSDNLLYNYGSRTNNPTQNNIQSAKFTIKGNNNCILASYFNEGDKTLSGIALTGTDTLTPDKQQFLGYDLTFKYFKQAVQNKGGTITLSNVSFESNESELNGNAIYNESGSVTLSGTSKIRPHLYNNSSEGYGGAIYNSGTMSIQYTDFGALPNEEFTFGNSALYGGAIDNESSLTVSNSAFTANFADNAGGAIYNKGSITSTSNEFVSNSSDSNGGAVWNTASFTDTSSTFESNTAELGGAIYMTDITGDAQTTLTKTLLIGNYATNGGAIYIESGVAELNNAQVGNSDSNYTNEADLGGGIFNKDTLTVANSFFNRNNAKEQGGAIYNEGTAEIKDSTFGSISNFDVANSAVDGGAIYNNGSLTDSSSKFTSNIATNGGAIFNKESVTLTKTALTNNTANSGGAIYNEGDATLTNATVNDNSSELHGAGIYNDITDGSKSLTIQTSTLNSNKTTNENGFGGAIYNNKGLVKILGSSFSSNETSRGGAIYNTGEIRISSSGNTQTTFNNNSSTFGGAIYNHGSLNIENTSFTLNNSISAGGALLLSILPTEDALTATINNSTFSKNSSDFGGAIYTLGATKDNQPVYNYVQISNSSFTNNNALHDGGAIYADTYSNITIVDSDFKNNTAGARGGAIFVNGGAVVSILAQSKNVVFSGNKANGKYNGIYLNSFEDETGNFFNAVLNLQANSGKTIDFNDYIAGTGIIYIYGNTTFNKDTVITSGSDITIEHRSGTLTIMNEASLAGTSLTTGNDTLNIANNQVSRLALKSLTLNGETKTAIDIDLKNRTSDKVQTGELSGEGKLVASTVSLTNNSRSPVMIEVGKDSVINSISTKKAESAEATYKLKSYYDENGLLRVVAYGQKAKPSAVAAPVAAQIGGYLTQINSYDQAFMNMDLNMIRPRTERESECDSSLRGANGDVAIQKNNCDNDISYNAKGLWNRPYATFERVNLNNGPKVSNIGYGNFFGGDADMKELNNGWKRQFSAYIGYNGSVQDYDRQSIDQNGGTVGVTEVWYKKNFFTGLTLNAGANVAQASTDLGRENMPMFMTGVASKTGYNFEFKEGKFIIQPSILLSYSFIHTFSHDNGRGSHVGSSPLNAIQVAPGIKFIANLKNGWQPYLGVNMRWNIIDKTHFSLTDVNIPDMSIDPYVEYGVGLQRRWGERFTGFGQAMIRNGGRNGVMLSFGFKWLIGK